MNTRAKFSMVKILAHHLESPSSPNLYDRVEELINYLDKKARPERNRFVHDDWDVQGEEVLRSQIGAKIRRPQAPQRELSVWTERRFPDITQIRAFVRNLELAYGDLVDLDSHLAWLASHQELPGLRSQPLPPEWKSLTHRDWRIASSAKK